MLKLLLVGLVLTSVTVLIHGAGTFAGILHITRIRQTKPYSQRMLGMELLIIRLTGILLIVHLVEAAVWAAFYAFIRLLPDFETAMYFSLTSFASLGYGDIVLSGPWRLLGPIEALTGILMMGWSTGIIVAAILRAYATRLDIIENDPKSDK